MKTVAIIYFSMSGHVEAMAKAIAKGAEENGGKVIIKKVNEARVNDIVNADFVFLGSPSMEGNKIDEGEMTPFVEQFKQISAEGKKLVLFGSYGWDDGEFMQKWVDRMISYKFDLVEKIIVKEMPNKKELEKCMELGKRAVEGL